MGYRVDINCDVGEEIGNDLELMPYISSCSVACGGHAGNSLTMTETVKLAMQHSVKVGAHPSFPDRENFGRKVILMPLYELQYSLENQMKELMNILGELGGELHHVKPHGALYNLAAVDVQVANVVINAVKNTAGDVFLYVPYNSVIQNLALKKGMKIKVEAFADRNYNSDLTLVPRNKAEALIIDEDVIVPHLLQMLIKQKVTTIDGVEVGIKADTFCVHGDNPNVVNLLKNISKKLSENGVEII